MARRRTAVIVVVLVVLWAGSAVGGAAAPALISSHAVVLALLSPRAVFVAGAAVHLPIAVFVVVFVTRLSIGDPLHYVLGRAHGGSWLRWLSLRFPGCAGGLTAAEGLVRRFGLPVTAMVPTGSVMAVAGAVGLPFAPAMSLNLLGTAARVLGLWLAAQAAPGLIRFMGELAAVAAPATAVVVWATVMRSHRRRRSLAAARAHHPSLVARSIGVEQRAA